MRLKLLNQLLASNAELRFVQNREPRNWFVPRSRRHLHLRCAASQFGICRRGNNAHLFDQVRAGIRHGHCANVIVPRVIDTDTIPCCCHAAGSIAGKDGESIVAAAPLHAAHRPDQIDDIAASQRQVRHFIVGKHRANRR